MGKRQRGTWQRHGNDEIKLRGLLRNKRYLALWGSSTSAFLALPAYLVFEQWYLISELDAKARLGGSLNSHDSSTSGIHGRWWRCF